MSLHVGQIVGDYRIVAIAGIGGMGEVYKVEHVITKRLEAMKVLSHGCSEEKSDRFLREIQVQASLNHPNIAAVHTAFRFGDDLALVMEFLEGKSLARILRTVRVPLPTMLGYMNQVLSALDYAHERGVIHRDVAPGNIIVASHGVIKLTDFGLAKRLSDTQVSLSGAFIGSPHYMSPEQAKGDIQADARSDIYSSGVVLYEVVTGRKLFESGSVFELLSAHVHQQPVAPIDLEPSLPRALNDIILRALAKDPAARFQSAHEFQAALQSVTRTSDLTSAARKPAAVSRIRPLWRHAPFRELLLGVASAATVMFAGTWWYVRSSALPAPAHRAPSVVEQPHVTPAVITAAPPQQAPSLDPQPSAESKPIPPSGSKRAHEPVPNPVAESEAPPQESVSPNKEPGKLRRAFGRILHPLRAPEKPHNP